MATPTSQHLKQLVLDLRKLLEVVDNLRDSYPREVAEIYDVIVEHAKSRTSQTITEEFERSEPEEIKGVIIARKITGSGTIGPNILVITEKTKKDPE